MDVLDRVESIRGARQKKRIEGRVDDVEHENDRLHAENESLRDQLHQERVELSRILDVLERGMQARGPRKHRLRRIAVLSIAAGSAYVAGSRAGRERFDQLRERWNRMMSTGRAEIQDRGYEAAEATERAGDRVRDAMQKAGDKAGTIADRTGEMAGTAAEKAARLERQAGGETSRPTTPHSPEAGRTST
jgi:hypothetical protein